MQPNTQHATPDTRHATRVARLLPLLLIILAVGLAFANSLQGEFFEVDDVESIRDNPHIRRLWPPSEPLCLPLWNTGATVDTRPVLALSFALNYQLTGDAPWGFHLVNLLIHAASALLLFGIVRRTLTGLSPSSRPRAGPTAFALVAAVVWAVHPLQTEAVTYTVQRAVSMMGMFYLLTLYGAIRGLMAHPARGDARPPQRRQSRNKASGGRASPRAASGAGKRTSSPREPMRPLRCSMLNVQCSMFPNAWHLVAILACACGMGTKESMVTAPVLVILYDWVFGCGNGADGVCEEPGAWQARATVARSRRERGPAGGTRGQIFAQFWRKRRGLYLGLFATWAIMIFLVAGTFEGMSRDASRIGVLRYAASQPLAILKYLRLAFWPRGLVLDYTNRVAQSWHEILLPALPLVALFVFSLVGVIKRRPVAFFGFAFFVLLAPSSSIAPTLNVYNEHRMYLALAAVAIPVLAGLDLLLRRAIRNARRCAVVEAILSVALIGALATGTFVRNRDWRTEEAFWTDNVAKRPASPTAQNNMGVLRLTQGRPAEAVEHFRQALRLNPRHAKAHNNWGMALERAGRIREAIGHYQQAIRLKPDLADGHYNLGNAVLALGRDREAIAHYTEALRIKPDLVEARFNMANTVLRLGHSREAIPHYRDVLRLKPAHADAHNNLAYALLALGRSREAAEHCREALRLRPDLAEAHFNMGTIHRESGRITEAIASFERALRLNPANAAARESLREAREMIEK